MKYKITDFNETMGQISIAYESGISINLDLPITDGKFPIDDELENMIQDAYPAWYVERINILKKVSNIDSIKSKVEVAFIPPITPEILLDNVTSTEQTIQMEIEKEEIFKQEVTRIINEVLDSRI